MRDKLVITLTPNAARISRRLGFMFWPASFFESLFEVH